MTPCILTFTRIPRFKKKKFNRCNVKNSNDDGQKNPTIKMIADKMTMYIIRNNNLLAPASAYINIIIG